MVNVCNVTDLPFLSLSLSGIILEIRKSLDSK